MEVLGLDIGGSGIKGAVVNIDNGELVTPRYRLPTPEKARPADVADVVNDIVMHFEWQNIMGCGFPTIIHDGVSFSAANIHKSWIGKNAAELFTRRSGCTTYVVNDADAAGLAEMTFGAGRNQQKGVVLMLTIGTGIGSAIFVDGRLLPNTEFGHLQIRGKDAEHRASDAIRQHKKLSWKDWAERFQEFLTSMENLMWPDLVIIGGGISKQYEDFFPYFKMRAKIVPAQLLNQAGVVGAAVYAARRHEEDGTPISAG
ncbi:MAG: polyphosphate--glucose phosphotransferase [Anaerolineaceae bacterium]